MPTLAAIPASALSSEAQLPLSIRPGTSRAHRMYSCPERGDSHIRNRVDVGEDEQELHGPHNLFSNFSAPGASLLRALVLIRLPG